jgi:hypothetical protein
MPLYALILGQPLSPQDLQHLLEAYPNSKKINDNGWAIRSPKTSKEISESLFPVTQTPEGPKATDHILLKITAWWGFHGRELWEWLDASAKEPNGEA